MKKQLTLIAALSSVGVLLGGLTSLVAADTTQTSNQTVTVNSQEMVTLTGGQTAANINADASTNNGFGSFVATNPFVVSTNNAKGATLTIQMISSDTNSGALVSSDASVTTKIDPVAAAGPLTANTWGYEPSAAAASTPTNITPAAGDTYKPVPLASGTPDQLLTFSSAGSQQIYVNFGAKIDYTLAPSTYSNQVTYTASVNP